MKLPIYVNSTRYWMDIDEWNKQQEWKRQREKTFPKKHKI